MKKLEDRIAVVTGAGSGMGRASSLLFTEEGATVIAVDIDEESAKATAHEIQSNGGQAVAVRADVTKVPELEELFAMVEKDYGVLHVLYSHVGTPGAAGMNIGEDEWQFAIDTNLKSAFFSAKLALPLLRKVPGHASIIFTASTTGLVGSPFSPLYSAAKGGVALLGKAVALHVVKDGVRANVICPGPIDTPMLPLFFGRPGTPGASAVTEEIAGFIATAVPMGRAGLPIEIARAALFLACDDSSFITGVTLPVDGGFTAR